MNNPHFLVLFHQVNYPLASALSRDLMHAGFTFTLVCEEDLGAEETFASRIQADARPLILMVSDNFLKSADCVHQLLPALREKSPLSVQIIVLSEGLEAETGTTSPTRLDRIGQILHYINFWQDRYLKLRKRQAEESIRTEAFETELKRTRQIAFDIGNLIEYFREQSAYPWDAFTANHYELFFRKSGNISLHEPFRQGAPYMDEDRDVEERLREEIRQATENSRLKEDDPGREEVMIRTMLREGEDTAGAENQEEGERPEKNLLSRLIAYKNGLVEEDVVLDDRTIEDTGDDDDWEEEEPEEDDREKPAPKAIVPLPAREAGQLRKQVAAHPENIGLRLELAALLSPDEANFQETTQLLEEVLRLDARNPRAFYLLGQLSEQYREHKLAQRYYEKSLESDPQMGQAHLALGLLLAQDPGQTENALDHLAASGKLMPDLPEVWIAYARVLSRAGRTKKAIKAWKKAFKLDPDNEEIGRKLAELYFQKGDRIKALKYHRESGKEKPDAPVTIPGKVPPTTKEKPTSAAGGTTETVRPARVLTVLITGATSGIGRATARLLAAHGHRLILTGRREDRLTSLQAELEARHHASLFILSFDIRQEAVTRQLIRALPPEWADIDVLINNAGLAKGLSPIHEGRIQDWDTMVDTNIKGLLYITRAVSPGMVARRKGQIINICSTAGKEVYPNGNVYCATKFAVDALTRGMRQDLVGYGIRVGQISPGHVEETEFALNRFDGDAEKARIYQDFNPLRAEDVAAAILYMLHQPPHVNIQDILMTGTQQAGSSLIERSGRIYDPEMPGE